MTAPDEAEERRSRADERGAGASGGRSRVTVYRWACPICGDSGTGIASGHENPFEKAAFSLRQHVRTSEDDAHGPANVFPSQFDPDAAGRAISIE